MRAKITIYIEGDRDAIFNVYEAIRNNNHILNKNTYWIPGEKFAQYKTIEATAYLTECKEADHEHIFF